jgi:hypothetical protein
MVNLKMHWRVLIVKGGLWGSWRRRSHGRAFRQTPWRRPLGGRRLSWVTGWEALFILRATGAAARQPAASFSSSAHFWFAAARPAAASRSLPVPRCSFCCQTSRRYQRSRFRTHLSFPTAVNSFSWMLEPSPFGLCGGRRLRWIHGRETRGTEDTIPEGYSAKGTVSRDGFVAVDCGLNYRFWRDWSAKQPRRTYGRSHRGFIDRDYKYMWYLLSIFCEHSFFSFSQKGEQGPAYAWIEIFEAPRNRYTRHVGTWMCDDGDDSTPLFRVW